MEFKKHMVRVLGIGLMLSVFSPVYAAEPKLTKMQLYRKCIARRCNEAEKAQVRAELKKTGKRAGALLIAAAVAIGAMSLLKELGIERRPQLVSEIGVEEEGDIKRRLQLINKKNSIGTSLNFASAFVRTFYHNYKRGIEDLPEAKRADLNTELDGIRQQFIKDQEILEAALQEGATEASLDEAINQANKTKEWLTAYLDRVSQIKKQRARQRAEGRALQ